MSGLPEESSNRSSRPREILVVDDERQVLNAMEDMLEDDFVVHTATSASEAMEIVGRHTGIAVIVSDQRMPEMDGATFLSTVQDLTAATRILLTGYSELDAVIRAINSGKIFAYLSKPWDPEQLKVVVQKAADYFALSMMLDEERRLLDNLMSSLPDAILFKDREHRFIQANQAAVRMYGKKSLDDLIGKTPLEVAPPDTARQQIEDEERIFATGEAIRDRVYRRVLPDGSVRWYSQTKAPVLDKNGNPFRLVGVTRDVTSRIEAEAVNRLLIALTRALTSSTSVEEGFDEVLRLIIEHTEWPYGEVWLIDSVSDRLVAGPAHLRDPARFRRFHDLSKATSFNVEEGLPGRARAARHSIWLADISDPEAVWFRRREAAVESGLTAAFAVPILNEEEVVGILTFFLDDARFADPHVKLIEGVARQLGLFATRLQTRSTLVAKEAELRLILDSAAEGIFGVDVNGRITFANPTCARLLGYGDPSDVKGLHLRDVFSMSEAPAGRLVEADALLAELGKGEEISAEAAMFRHSDETSVAVEYRARPIRGNGSVSGAVFSFQDISDRIRTQRALRESEQRFRSAFDSAAHGVALARPDGRFIEVNSAFQTMTGYSEQELLERDFQTITHPDDLDADLANVERLLGGEISSYQMEKRYVRKSGSEIPILMSVGLVRDDEGRPLSFIAQTVDLSDKKEAEAQLLQAQKMEAIGRLTGGIAHDFNNILGVILGNAELLHDKVSNDRHRRMVDRVVAAAERGADLTRRLLAFSRRQDLAPSVVSVGAMLNDLMGMLSRIIGGSIEIDLRVGADVWPISVDQNQLENAIINLCINARDAMPDGGSLRIESENITFGRDYRDATNDIAKGSYVGIYITDTGTGMSREVQERIFEPFFTTKPQEKGTGLGMSMVLGFVKQSGGYIAVYSEVGHGTTMKLYFPRTEPGDSTGPSRTPDEASRMPTGSGRILLVDDDGAFRETVATLLDELGYDVVEAASGNEALMTVRDRDDIDLLLTDVIMPGGINGVELVETVRSERPHLPCILHSGYTEKYLIDRITEDALTTFLSKPTPNDVLARTVRDALARVVGRSG